MFRIYQNAGACMLKHSLMSFPRYWFIGICWGLYAVGLPAADLPSPDAINPQHCGPTERSEVPASEAGALEIEAGSMTREGAQLELRDDVRLRFGPWLGRADQASVDQEAKHAHLQGSVHVAGPGVLLEAVQAELDYGNQAAKMEQARYRLDQGATGTAARLRGDATGVVEAEQATYSTCALEDPTWHLEVEEIHIDREAGQGEAHDVTLRIGNTPVAAFPWIGFPVGDARKSGWLVPEVGTSDSLGYSLEVPYYLNLAPHYDATLSARYMGRRGLQIKPSGRYRTHHGEGALNFEFLSDNEEDGDNDRYLMHWRHRGERPNGLDYQVFYTNVSDARYLEDFQSGVSGLSTTRLRQEAHVAWRSQDWRVQAAWIGTDPLKDRSESWDRLPRVRADGRWHWPETGLVFEPQVAFDAFDADLDRKPVDGDRYDVSMALSRPIVGTGWSFTPRMHWRHTRYDLDGRDLKDDDPRRTVPTFSLDARMRFERRAADGGLQTLEPRLFYLNRPHRDQEHLPLFDTRRMEPDYDALFRHEEHAGLDRMDAADQLTLGVGTRSFDPVKGYMRLHAQLGRVWYFRAPGVNAETQGAQSAWAAQVEWRPHPQWRVRSGVRYDSGSGAHDTAWASHMIGWRGAADQQVQVRYVRRVGELEQAGAHMLWPLGGGWQLAARYFYDMREGRDLEILAALEYRGCCMTVGLGVWKVRREEEEPGEDYENRLMLQVRFHGLAGFGEDVMSRMNRELHGEPVWLR